MSDDLSPRERAILLTLLLHGPTLSNSKSSVLRLRVAAGERERLNAFGLVTSVKKTAYQHRLTDAGRRWCLKELASGRAHPGNSPLERVFYSLLAAVRAEVDLPALFHVVPVKAAGPPAKNAACAPTGEGRQVRAPGLSEVGGAGDSRAKAEGGRREASALSGSRAELAVQAAYKELRDAGQGGVSLAALLDAFKRG